MFIKAEAKEEDGTMLFFNLKDSDAGIELFYTNEVETTNDDGGTDTIRKPKQYKLNFGSTIVNTFKGEYPADVLQAISSSNEEAGAEKLFLDGGEGSMAVVELFEDEDQIAALKEKNWLINEANLTFYVDQDFVENVNEPTRIYLYDLDNNKIIADYNFALNFVGDGNENNPATSLASFSGPLKRDEDDNGISYKLNLTQHVTNIIEDEAENVRLGLVVTQNINITNNSAVRNTEDVASFPAMSVLSPEGTVLHGNLSTNEEKRLKLRIYYTEIK